MMDQKLLISFVTLAEELNFVRAAERLRITQSGLSQQIAKLEQVLGFALFDRTRRRVALTDPGRSLLEEGRIALRQLDLAVEMARRASEGRSGRLTIGFADAAALNILPKLTSEFSRRFSGVNIILHEMISSEQVEALRAGRIQIGLLRPVFDSDEEFETHLLLRERYVVAVATNHRLADQHVVRIRDLATEGLIMTRRVKALYLERNFQLAFRKAGIQPKVVQEVNELHAILGLVAGGLGVALFPKSITKLNLDGVAYRPLHAQESPVAELLIASRSDERSIAARNFVRMAINTLKPLTGGEDN
ncbi:LysR family transcriptional regulator [Pseudorhizobium endolithicum]|uniref:LysR family transcriptional regulator n=1 Tax=Pseudorhizobium endolithicum TaxID=1191678 RepID=A0ABM8PM72_9HYPH|nr:LysR family transcriptional regulator [Pseudorhizobium endolithicum]CAD7037534.1 LysR family transcriptional regulator [Pseudorhizobium endolithicum]